MQSRPKVFYECKGNLVEAKLDQCLYEILGDTIDVHWDQVKAIMTVYKSDKKMFQYVKDKDVEIFRGVPFFHGKACPFLDQNIEKNIQKTIKPCACVLIQNKSSILVTQRSKKISFGGAWVLPGGHLEYNQSVIEGGLRQCFEEVGLNHKQSKPRLEKGVMVWQSVFTVDGVAKASGIVLFFVAETQHFEVKVLEKEVEAFKWKQIHDLSDEKKYKKEEGDGYAQGHLKFLQFYRQHNKIL